MACEHSGGIDANADFGVIDGCVPMMRIAGRVRRQDAACDIQHDDLGGIEVVGGTQWQTSSFGGTNMIVVTTTGGFVMFTFAIIEGATVEV